MAATFQAKDWARHLKTGGVYEVIAVARMERSPDDEVVVYRSIETKQVWVRPRAEFCDGRFVFAGRAA